jgi:hypothetical protein
MDPDDELRAAVGFLTGGTRAGRDAFRRTLIDRCFGGMLPEAPAGELPFLEPTPTPEEHEAAGRFAEADYVRGRLARERGDPTAIHIPVPRPEDIAAFDAAAPRDPSLPAIPDTTADLPPTPDRPLPPEPMGYAAWVRDGNYGGTRLDWTMYARRWRARHRPPPPS